MNETNWDDLRLFLAVAREGGLSRASQLTGRSPATLSRRMLGLEAAKGQTLFVRHDRGYGLTADGQALLDSLSGIEAELDAAVRPVTVDTQPIVRVSAGSWTTLWLLDHLDHLTGTPPDVMLRFTSAEAVLDMPHRAVAIGIRNTRPTEPTLAGRQVGEVRFAPFARPDAPDLWIKVMADTPSARWVADHAGEAVACEVTAPRNALDLALSGAGIALLPTFVAARKAGIEQRGAEVAALTHARWVVTHQDDRHLPAVRRVINRLYALLDVGRRT